MAHSLPSLRNLQVFEAAARHQSFRAAADALFLTHGAVSRQVRALEAELGVRLFDRVGRKVLLTEPGSRLQAAVGSALKLIEASTTALRQDARRDATRLTITVLPAFAARWLKPRLADFRQRHPNIEPELVETIAPLDLAEKGIALGIRNGAGRWAGLVAERLAEESLVPVAAPGGIHGFPGLPQSAHELAGYPLLNPYDDWPRWFRRAGVLARAPGDGPTFGDAQQLLQAAEQGRGIALGRSWLVADAIEAGTLVRLPGPAIPNRRDYYLVHPEGLPLPPAAGAFAAWLHERMRGG